MAVINDLVLVHVENKPGFYARIEDISPDVKPGWWQVKLLVLTFPLQIYSWILDESQIGGAPFTMGGTPVKLEKVVSPAPKAGKTEHSAVRQNEPKCDGEKAGAKVVPLFDRKKGK
ncbi:MAG: hypothetical protein FD174_3992 [Geobacteraceae bacterium]|nr:MAG: hypothetical protein FD174_3992 [Geobacteraceae bacterium]